MIRLQNGGDDASNGIDALNMDDGVDNLDSDINLDDASVDIDPALNDSTNSSSGSSQNNLNSFSKNVLSKLIEKDMPPLPSNYQIYFEQMLGKESMEFQKKIYTLLEAEEGNNERNINFEKNINAAFVNTKEILKCILGIYKNLTIMNEIEKKWFVGLKRGDTHSDKYIEDISAIQKTIDKQNNELKLLYNKGNTILENINTNKMYDSKFDVYNKRYFIHLVQEELKAVQKFQHTSTILMMTLPTEVSKYLTNDKTALIVMKTIAKLLLKTSRRSDMIGYIGNGIFGMLLKHSDIFSSKKASERLVELLNNTNIFIGDNDINLDIKIGIAKISPNRSAETSLNYSISALRSAQKIPMSYFIYKEDDE